MKKSLTLIALILFVATANVVFGQANNSEVVTIQTKLESSMFLNMATTPVVFDFNTIEDYENGMAATNKNSGNATEGAVISTSNWNLSVVAQSPMVHEDGTTELPIDNIGLTVDFTGYNKVKNYAKNQAVALATSETMILGKQGNKSNAGDEEANSFVIYWEMGTGNGSMRSESLMEQDLKKGNYNMDVAFVLTEVI